jgi:glycosyltransferase involved in cell wall biosynthesis
MNNWIKKFLLKNWKRISNFNILMNLVLFPHLKSDAIKVNYAGAISGNRGGPRVKLSRLKMKFPEHKFGFNLVYVLSNYPYLTPNSISRLKDSDIPIVLNQNGVYFPGWYGSSFHSQNQPNIEVYENANYVFWQSEFARESSRKYLSASDPRGEILYNAVDLLRFVPSGKKGGKNFTFLLAGNLNMHQFYQIEIALLGMRQLHRYRNIRLKIVGCDDSTRQEVSKLTETMKLTSVVEVGGKYSQSQAPQILKESQAYLALKYMDTCPNLVIEALATGLPVVYSKSGGTQELVDSNSGVGLTVTESWELRNVVPNAEELASAMLEVVDLRELMSLSARCRAESLFDIRFWYQRHKEVFLNLINGGT